MPDKMADQIREYAFDNYIKPARDAGQSEVTIRAGDVHDAMNLNSRMPAVCGALGTNKFEQEYGVKRLGRSGPGQGATAMFVFAV